ncbi:MAG TPA: ribbon-helix-helix domain-containing protein [Jatrophihabitans sp.]|jgi:hypothetical protein|nr:ribbon-helix-helix domain-containing protein [Jatrophihabitans sp.]
MQLQHHVTQVSEHLANAAALGDDRTEEIAAALAAAATPAVRLALLRAVTEAADEITAALLDYPGSPAVTVHIDGEGDEVGLDVHATQPVEEPADAGRRDDGEPTARISLRLTDALKAEIDAAAEREGISVNTWLVRVAANAVRGTGTGFTFPPGANFAAARGNTQRVTGWING